MIGKLMARLFGEKPAATVANLSIGDTPRYVDALPFARRAIELFGGVRDDRAEWLAAAVVKHLNSGRLSEAILSDGTLLSKDEVAALGFDRWRKLAREPLDALTPDGRVDPFRTMDVVVRRVAAWLYAENRRRQTIEADGAAFEGCEVEPDIGACIEAQALAGKLYSPKEAPLLPLWNCRNEACQCLTRVKIKRRKR